MARRLALGGMALAALLLATACYSERIEECDCPDVTETAAPDVPADVPAPDGDATPPAGWVGQPCAQDADCGQGHTCVTKKYLEDLQVQIDGLEVTNGMCSMLFCAEDADCGPGGLCYDTSPFSGNAINICLLTCVDMADCRWQEGYTCFYAAEDDPNGACLPDSIAVAILCNDGHCEEQP